MHLARFFDGYFYSTESSFTEELWLKRKRPVITDGIVDNTFYDKPALVRYNVKRQGFEYAYNLCDVLKVPFTPIEEKYLDKAWEHYPSPKDFPPHMKIVSQLIPMGEKISFSNQKSRLTLDSEGFLRYIGSKRCRKEVPDCGKGKPKGLRV